MTTLRKRFTIPAAIVLALAITPALSGCFANPIEQIIEGATGGDVDLGGKNVPDGFPSEVPLVDGDVQFGAKIGKDGEEVFNVTIKVTGGSPVDTIKSQLEGAGFTATTEFSGDTTEGGTLVYQSDAWGVLVVVGKDGNDYIANYSVTSAAKSE